MLNIGKLQKGENMEKNNLKETRLRAGYSQKSIADLLHVSKSSISLWESGKVSPSIESLYSLAYFFLFAILASM